jgi:membrane associated rhomboid family serine protease
MGLYDREYSRHGEQPGYQLSAPQSATMQLLAITIAVYVLQLVFGGSDGGDPRSGFTGLILLPSDWYRRPWEAYRLITYGFAHSTTALEHILMNMLVLGLFGRPVEDRYGRNRFLAFYLLAIVAGGLLWSLTQSLAGGDATLVGASAATTAIFLLFALNFPRQEIQMMMIFPMPAWVAALIGVLMDVYGAMKWAGPIAFTAHLGGAAFAWSFYRYEWLPAMSLERWTSSLRSRRRTRLRVHAPEEDEADDLGRQVDEILAKIKEHGQDSLTRSERRILERASREYQQKRR